MLDGGKTKEITMKSVFITGGTTGMGLELAKIYLKLGWKVGVCGRDPLKFKEGFPYGGDDLYYYQVDVTDKEALQKAISDFSHSIGLDLLIASAGISFPHKTKIPDFERSYYMVHVNLLGVMYAFEAAMKEMLPKKRGHLVAISSVAGFNGLPGVSAYSATKSAVTKYCESLSLDLSDYGITVTSIHPGFVDTPLTRVNPHPMPFKLSAAEAAKKIARAIEKKKMHYSFPFLFSFVVKFLSLLPRTWYKRLMKIKFFNFSKEH